jgi:hypothetical protein
MRVEKVCPPIDGAEIDKGIYTDNQGGKDELYQDCIRGQPCERYTLLWDNSED